MKKLTTLGIATYSRVVAALNEERGDGRGHLVGRGRSTEIGS